MTERFNKGYALLIGVGESAYTKLLSLPATVKDTQAIYAALIDPELCAYPEEHIQVLNNEKAKCSAILDGLKWLKEKAKADPEATVFIYYSGHGCIDTNDNSYYLLPHDAKLRKLKDSALSAKVFTEALHQIQAERMLVIVDSCHAAGMAAAKDADSKSAEAELSEEFDDFKAKRISPPKGVIDELKQGKGRVVFTSSRGEEKSYIKPDESNSIYTYHLLEALQGAGNQPGDTEVRVTNLMSYVYQAVRETAKKLGKEQTPIVDMDRTEDFVIAKLLGGKGLPSKGWEEIKPEATKKINKIADSITQIAEKITNINEVSNVQDFHIGDVINKS